MVVWAAWGAVALLESPIGRPGAKSRSSLLLVRLSGIRAEADLAPAETPHCCQRELLE